MSSPYLYFLKVLPKNLLSRFMGCLGNSSISKPFIPWFAKKYNINLDEASQPIESYPTLNKFFTRHLKEGLRPIDSPKDSSVITSPVDGCIAQYGPINDRVMIQAKGREYLVHELLGSEEEAKPYINGHFMTIYLSPTDYHRMHHYVDGEITGFRYIPGKLFPVNEFSVANVESLFSINERLTTYLSSNNRPTAIVKVGATVVGKIKVAYDKTESNCGTPVTAKTFDDKIAVKRGDEMGLFEMGSTVVILFPKDGFEFDKFELGTKVKLGEKLGSWK